MTPPATYVQRRGEIAEYFDRIAVDDWRRLTSSAPVGRIRATVRAGRDRMRRQLVTWLPRPVAGRLLDAGCGTGALALDAATRGADVLAVDLSPNLIGLARKRCPSHLGPGRVRFLAGDMLSPEHGEFDIAVAMDSLIHYSMDDAVEAVVGLAARVRRQILFTYAPWTPTLALMHRTGKLFPRSDRSPDIQPVPSDRLRRALQARLGGQGWRIGRSERVVSGFYRSQALELVRP